LTIYRWFLVALSACAAFGQPTGTGTLDWTFQFSGTDPMLFAETATAIRTMTGLPVALDQTRGSLTVQGTAADSALAEWIFKELDTPSRSPAAEFRVPGGADDVLRVYRPSRLVTPQSMQETVNAIRSLVEERRIVLSAGAKAILLRGTVASGALAEWIVSQLDQPSASGTSQYLVPGNYVPVVRVVRPANIKSPQSLQELVNALRSIAEVQRVVPINEPAAVVLRGSAAQADLAEWIVRQLDQPAGGPAPRAAEFSTSIEPVSAVRVSFLAAATPLLEVINRIRARAQVQRVIAFSPLRAIVLRGTPAQVAQSAGIIAEMEKGGEQ
jgi:hypothetical protein